MKYHYWNEYEVKDFFHRFEDFKPPPKEKHWAKTDLILGDARANCQGAGICKISVRGEGASQACRCAYIPAWLGRVNANCLQLLFDKRLLTLKQFTQHFAHQKVILSKPIILPSDISRQLGFSGAITLKADTYRLSQYGNYYHHFLECCSANHTSDEQFR